MCGAKLAVTAKWNSNLGENVKHILTVKPLTVTYHQLMLNGNIIDIDIINNRSTLKGLIELVVKDMINERMITYGQFIDQYVVMSLENLDDCRREVIKTDINLQALNVCSVDLNTESDVYKVLMLNIVNFIEVCCTMFVKLHAVKID